MGEDGEASVCLNNPVELWFPCRDSRPRFLHVCNADDSGNGVRSKWLGVWEGLGTAPGLCWGVK